MKDKKFPIIFLILALVVTFGFFLTITMIPTITGAAIGSAFSGWTIIWTTLIIISVFVGIVVLRKEK